MDSWEEGFDSWTPATPVEADAGEETGTELDRAELLRLARELAERRHAPQPGADAEVEQLKRALRERAEAIAARERELAELQRRLERDRPGVRSLLELRSRQRGETVDGEALAARERATHERTRALAERERAAEAQAAELEAEAARLAKRERELDDELQAVEAKLAETEAERELAAAERERLEERDRAVHEREKALAAARAELDAERRKLETQATAAERDEQPDDSAGRASAAAALAAAEERERALAGRESKLEASECELALVRQGLDVERKALVERERLLRRREVTEARESLAQPFATPSFSEGLAALARARSRS